MAVQKIDPEHARRDVESGNALLVSAYDDEEKCRKYRLPKAITLSELQAREAALPKDKKIFFYCA